TGGDCCAATIPSAFSGLSVPAVSHPGFVAPLEAAPVCRSATDTTLLQRSASEEARCFGVRAAERSVDAALVVPEETNPLTPNQDPNQFHCMP
ncbi:MAG: hypothetical protein K9N62_09110, partial [Verrucomicrobia bacterium]|nr:hypothetical protein [Verrucomicrobiota bacterium]